MSMLIKAFLPTDIWHHSGMFLVAYKINANES